MSQPELLIRVIRVLESVGIQYMLTGSVASSIHGEPRATHDIDLVAVIPRDAVPDLAAAFHAPDYFLDELAVREAIDSGDQFNVIDWESGDKIDFWLLGSTAFDQARFSRRVRCAALGTSMWVSSAEDIILAKLRWARLCGGSEKQFGDALRVYEVQFDGLHQAYLDQWAAQLGVTDLLDRIRSESEPA